METNTEPQEGPAVTSTEKKSSRYMYHVNIPLMSGPPLGRGWGAPVTKGRNRDDGRLLMHPRARGSSCSFIRKRKERLLIVKSPPISGPKNNLYAVDFSLFLKSVMLL